MSEQEQTFPTRPASEGASVTFTIHDEERTIEATQEGDGWVIAPRDAEEARALAFLPDAALQLAPSGYAAMTNDELKGLLAERGQPTSGKKAELITRLEEGDAARHAENAGAPGQEDQAS